MSPGFRLSFFLLLYNGLLFGQALQNSDQAIPVDQNVTIGTLPNGLRYYIRKNSRPENRAELRLAIKAGSVLEDDNQIGLAHFLEHMALKGTKNFSKNDIVSHLESIGLKSGTDLNAYSSFDETVYILPIPTDNEKNVEKSFQLLEDWAHQLSLSHEEIDAERAVIIEEWRSGQGIAQRLRDKTFPVLLKDSRYADRLPVGQEQNLLNFSYSDLERFYKDWYRPDLMAVIAVGDFDSDEIEGRIKKHFGSLENPLSSRERTQYILPEHDSTYFVIATDPEVSYSTVSMYIKSDASPENSVRDYSIGLMHVFYTGMLNKRLQEVAEKPDSPFLFAGTNYDRLLANKDAFTVVATVEDGDFIRGFQALLEECARVERHGFTQPELERFKKEFMRYIEQVYSEREKAPSEIFAQEYIRNFLTAKPIPGIEFEYQYAKQYIDSIRIEDINLLSKKLFGKEDRVVVINGPAKEGIIMPSEQQFSDILSKIETMHISPYIDEIAGTKLIENNPLPGEIVSEKTIQEVGITELILSNGVKVILKPTTFKNDEVLMAAWSNGGTSLYSDADYQSASSADAIANECGIARYSPTDLQKILAGKTVNVRPYIGALGEGLSGSCAPKDMEYIFQLNYLYFTAPNKSKDLFDAYIEKNKAVYKTLLTNPSNYFYNESAKIIGQNHLRGGQFPSEMDWGKFNFDRAFKIYQERFGNAGDFNFVFVGSYQVDTIKKFIRQYIASLPSTHAKETWKDPGVRPPDGMIKKDFRKGNNSKCTISMRFLGKYVWDRSSNHQIKSLGEALSILLTQKVRTEHNEVGIISAKTSTNKEPYNNYAVNITFSCPTQISDTVVHTITSTIRDIQENGVSQEQLNKLKETQRGEMDVNIKENGYWLGALKNSYQYGQDPTEINSYRALIDELSSTSLQVAAKKYLNTEKYILLRLLPEN